MSLQSSSASISHHSTVEIAYATAIVWCQCGTSREHRTMPFINECENGQNEHTPYDCRQFEPVKHVARAPDNAVQFAQRLLGQVGMGDKDCLVINDEWCQFVRAVLFHKETAKNDFEAHIMPSLAALYMHRRRAEYVLHIAFTAPFSVCTHTGGIS